jgi:chromosome segregation ATPase
MLRQKSGQMALRCVADALPVAESLLSNWDYAWGAQMHHLTARVSVADAELERMREQTERALAEAEAYRAEMDANEDRVERAAAIHVEKDQAKAALESLQERFDAERRSGERTAAAATAATAAAEARAEAMGRERDRLAADIAECRAACDAAEQAAHQIRGELYEATERAAESKTDKQAVEEMREALVGARAENRPLRVNLKP